MSDKTDVHLPLSIAIVITAFGLACFGALIWWARKASPAVAAALDAGDAAVAGVVNKVKDHLQAQITAHQAVAAASTDPAVIAQAQSQIVSLQALANKVTDIHNATPDLSK